MKGAPPAYTAGEAAAWDIPLLMQRGNNASATALARPGAASLVDIAPTIVPADTDLGAAKIDLSTSGASLVVTADVSGLPGGQDVAWSAVITELEAR